MQAVPFSKIRKAAFEAARDESTDPESPDNPTEFLEAIEGDSAIADALLVNGCEALGIPFVGKWGYPGEAAAQFIPNELKTQLWGKTWEHGLKVWFAGQECLVVGLDTHFESDDPEERLLSSIEDGLKLGQPIPIGCDFSSLYLVPANLVVMDK